MKAPTFKLRKMNDDEEVSLQSFFGKPIMLTFWASWCPDSQKDLHMKDQFYRSIQSDQLVFLTINVTGREGEKGAGEEFINKQNYTFPALIDEGTKTYDAYRCMGVPTTVLINKEHEVVATFGDKARFTEILKHVGKIL